MDTYPSGNLQRVVHTLTYAITKGTITATSLDETGDRWSAQVHLDDWPDCEFTAREYDREALERYIHTWETMPTELVTRKK